MPIQDFNIYTARGYAGELVDSGPRVVQTGVLTGSDAAMGVAIQREPTVERGIKIGSTANVFAITQREYNHEAGSRPAKDGDWQYLEKESVSIIRQGYLYVSVSTLTADTIVAGQALFVDAATGAFTADITETETLNVIADESADISGDSVIVKVRIDVVSG